MKIEFAWNPKALLISTNSSIYYDVSIPPRRVCAYVLVQFEVAPVFSLQGMDMRNNLYLWIFHRKAKRYFCCAEISFNMTAYGRDSYSHFAIDSPHFTYAFHLKSILMYSSVTVYDDRNKLLSRVAACTEKYEIGKRCNVKRKRVQ